MTKITTGARRLRGARVDVVHGGEGPVRTVVNTVEDEEPKVQGGEVKSFGLVTTL